MLWGLRQRIKAFLSSPKLYAAIDELQRANQNLAELLAVSDKLAQQYEAKAEVAREYAESLVPEDLED